MGRAYIDLKGMVFGALTVVRRYGKLNGQIAWWCRCRCGTRRYVVRGMDLRKGSTKSCGCGLGRGGTNPAVEHTPAPRGEFKRGDSFGHLRVLGPDEGNRRWGQRWWVCKCQCGTVRAFPTGSLRRGVQSCGCRGARKKKR